jgi:CO/xanthine dehydrogenase Mo-binding subunit
LRPYQRSPHPHALIKSIDVSKASAYRASAVVTGEVSGLSTVLAGSHLLPYRVRYIGDRWLVAAVTEEIAEQALALIDVEYGSRPVTDQNTAPVRGSTDPPDLKDYVVVPSYSLTGQTSPAISKSAR